MNPRLAAVAARQGGVFTRAQALAAGVSDDRLRQLTRAGTLRRLRRGAYVDAGRFARQDAVGRHLLQVHAVALSLETRAAFSHTSAAALHGLALWAVDLSTVHVTRLDRGAARALAGVHHHVGALSDDELVLTQELPAVAPARAVVEIAMIAGFEPGVIAADSALHRGMTTPKDLDGHFEAVRQWPGATCVGSTVAYADGRSESVGETRARLLFTKEGLPTPIPQQDVVDDYGDFVGRVDFLLADERTVVEFDGQVKYRGSGPAASDAVVLEKAREDRLRELGYQVVRLTWPDLDRPERTAGRLRAAFARTGPPPPNFSPRVGGSHRR